MTIHQFKEWASQTGVEMLLVADLTLYKSQKAPWYHEFIVVTLEPHKTFKPRAFATRENPLHPFDLDKNIKEGLRFRIDRGRQEKRPRRPHLGSSGSHPAAADLVELINFGTPLDAFHLCFSYGSPKGLRATDTAFFDFVAPRVHDVLYCVDGALNILGPQYKLHSRNCWVFASVIFQLMNSLFPGVYKENYTNSHKNFIRKRFFGTSFADSWISLNSPLFTPKSIFIIKEGSDVP